MATSLRSAWTHLWEGFLPKNAIIMARRKSLERMSPFPSGLEGVQRELQDCRRCKLCENRKTLVLGEGNPHSKLVFIGEGPGELEDLQGRPFLGEEGKLLDKMLEAIGLQRENVYLLDMIKCKTPESRKPEKDEIDSCSPFLFRQMDAIQPQIIVALGEFTAQFLLQSEERISQMRGKFYPFRNAKVIPFFHPKYLLKNSKAKRQAWLDLQLLARELGLELPKRSVLTKQILPSQEDS